MTLLGCVCGGVGEVALLVALSGLVGRVLLWLRRS
jgi:hypothetical protein